MVRRLGLLLLALIVSVAASAFASSLEDLAERLVNRSRSHVRVRAITELEQLDPASKAALVPLLLPGLERTDPYERMNAAYALGYLDGHARPALEALRPLLTDPSAMVRQQARATLGRLGDDRLGAIAAEMAEYRRLAGTQDLESQLARHSAMIRLGYVLAADGERPPEAIATLADALGDPYEAIRHRAAQGLWRVSRDACPVVLPAVPALLQAIGEGDRNTAYLAYRTLEMMGLADAERQAGRRTASNKDAGERRRLAERLNRELAARPRPPSCP